MNSEPRAVTQGEANCGRWHSSPYVTLAFLCAAAAVAYAQRQVVAVTKESMQAELELTKNQVGWIMSAFFIGYSLFQIPLGWLCDRCGPRRALIASVAFSALATALLPASSSMETMIFVWTICGIAQAGLFPIAARLIVATFPATRRAIASGLLGSSMSVGAATMAAAGGELLGLHVRWQFVVLSAAIPGFIWALAFLALYREGAAGQPSQADRRAVDRDLAMLLSKPNLWLICGQQFFRAAGYVFFVSWFSTYLQETGDIDIERAGWLNGLPLLGVVLGSPFGGVVSDLLLSRTGNRRLSQQALAVVTLLACAASVIAALRVETPVAATVLISFGSFCAAMCGAIGYAVTMHMGGARVATVFAIMNAGGNLGAALFPTVAAQLRTATGDWNMVLVMFAGIYVVAAICWMLIDPK
jgi:MFS transporter, ACS family, D-galactonate transporter